MPGSDETHQHDGDDTARQAEFWSRYLHLVAEFGQFEEYADGLVVTLDPGVTADLRLTRDQLQAYIDAFVQGRLRVGLDPGLHNGLPNPLIDSVTECLGSQTARRSTYALSGLDLVEVASSEHCP